MRMAQDTASFKCEPWRWKAEEKQREGLCVWRILKQKNKRNGKGRETNVRAAMREIKKIPPK